MWMDIIINKIVTKAELANAICYIFQIDSTELLITYSLEIVNVNEEIKVICYTKSCKTNFPLILSFYISIDAPKDSLIMVGEFCEVLKCTAIISDDSLNPYTMLQVKGKDLWEQITIDISMFDDNEGIELL